MRVEGSFGHLCGPCQQPHDFYVSGVQRDFKISTEHLCLLLMLLFCGALK